ncbi:hypothetical protein FHS36_003732 [Streptomyces eurocidicus]|uniref:Uncharacterized protein n=1 Tax=Streptomyces eurocidicus TaxID=66423 RepID=A0A7W8F3X1_STREU|nr:hypothetical protein [Streptomyces eurocidicus]
MFTALPRAPAITVFYLNRSVRRLPAAVALSCPHAQPAGPVLPPLLSNLRGASPMADLAFLGLIALSFALLHLVVKGVEKL